MSEGFAFLGFRIQWRRKKGTKQWHAYTFIDQRPIKSLTGPHAITAADPLPDDLHQAIDRIHGQAAAHSATNESLMLGSAQSELPLPGLVATSPTTPPRAVVASASGASAGFF